MPLIYTQQKQAEQNAVAQRRAEHLLTYSDSLWSDDMYKQALEEYRNNPWFNESRYMDNPYLRSRIADYQPDFWTGAFNSMAGAAEYYGGYRTKAMEELSRINREAYEEWYNNAINQVGRERAAGLNPDLNGNVTAGEASQNDNLAPSDIKNGTGSGMAAQTAQTIFGIGDTIVKTALSVVSGIQGINGLGIDNAVKSLELNNTFRGAAKNFLQEGISEFLKGNQVSSQTMQKPEFVQSTLNYFLDRLEKSPFSKREKKSLSPIIKQLISAKGEAGEFVFTTDFEKMITDSFGSLYDSRADATEAFGRVGGDNETISGIEFMADKIYKPLNEMYLDVIKLQNKYSKSYFGELNAPISDSEGKVIFENGGKARGRSENTAHALQSQLFNVKQRIDAFFKQVDDDINSSGLPAKFKLGLRSGLASAETLWLTQLNQGLHFGFGSSESNHTYESSGSYSTGVSKSRTWHF